MQSWLAEILPLVTPLPGLAVLQIASLDQLVPSLDRELILALFTALAGCAGPALRTRQLALAQARLSYFNPSRPIGCLLHRQLFCSKVRPTVSQIGCMLSKEAT